MTARIYALFTGNPPPNHLVLWLDVADLMIAGLLLLFGILLFLKRR
jgi:hypothetical protein